jgi:hypothetical protein
MANSTYVQLEQNEAEVLEEAMENRFGKASRISKGGMIRLLAEQELGGSNE